MTGHPWDFQSNGNPDGQMAPFLVSDSIIPEDWNPKIKSLVDPGVGVVAPAILPRTGATGVAAPAISQQVRGAGAAATASPARVWGLCVAAPAVSVPRRPWRALGPRLQGTCAAGP